VSHGQRGARRAQEADVAGVEQPRALIEDGHCLTAATTQYRDHSPHQTPPRPWLLHTVEQAERVVVGRVVLGPNGVTA
jgi:hypothetical protein